MRLAQLRADRADQLRLGQLAAESAKLSFELPQLPELLGESHCNL